jgi:hypothetical protein
MTLVGRKNPIATNLVVFLKASNVLHASINQNFFCGNARTACADYRNSHRQLVVHA